MKIILLQNKFFAGGYKIDKMNALADIRHFPAYNAANCRRTESTVKYTENRTGKFALKQNLMVDLSLKWSIMNLEASFRRLNMFFHVRLYRMKVLQYFNSI
mgnify:CR=1 FL=1